jgi:hypothetical protein
MVEAKKSGGTRLASDIVDGALAAIEPLPLQDQLS